MVNGRFVAIGGGEPNGGSVKEPSFPYGIETTSEERPVLALDEDPEGGVAKRIIDVAVGDISEAQIIIPFVGRGLQKKFTNRGGFNFFFFLGRESSW